MTKVRNSKLKIVGFFSIFDCYPDLPETYSMEQTVSPKSQSLALLVVILAGLTAFAPLSIDMYLPSFPQIAADFGVSVARVELSLAS